MWVPKCRFLSILGIILSIALLLSCPAWANSEPPTPIFHYYGDATGDRIIAAADLSQMNAWMLGLPYSYDTLQPQNPQQDWNTSDVTSDRLINAADISVINNYMLGLQLTIDDKPWALENFNLPLTGNPSILPIPFQVNLSSTSGSLPSGRAGLVVKAEIIGGTTTGELTGRTCSPLAGFRDQPALPGDQCALSVTQTDWSTSAGQGLTESGFYGFSVKADGGGTLNLKFSISAVPSLDIPATSVYIVVSFNPPILAASIDAGYGYTCEVTTEGGAKCWGANGWAQLGDGTVIDKGTPVDVQGLTSGVTAISAGYDHSCALTTSGGVKCWGMNGFGQLGNGTWTDSFTPVDVSGLTSGVIEISSGGYYTCAVTILGEAKCWGDNYFGELGDGTTTNRNIPADVSGLSSGAASISAGYSHACALTTSGGVKCWGYNWYGEIGDGTQTDSWTPIDVVGLTSGAAAVSAGDDHTTCALMVSGGVKCWGSNYVGQLGDGTNTDSYIPVDVSGLASGVVKISAGVEHACALTASGGIKCWGNNFYGQIGDGTTSNRNTPVDVSGLTNGVSAVSAGWYHTCALMTSNVVKCWGDDNYGELGDGIILIRPIPVDVLNLTNAGAIISSGARRTCAVTASGGAMCWGDNHFGQIGDGTTLPRPTPVGVKYLTGGVIAISAGFDPTCAAKLYGLSCWGLNGGGEVGDGTTIDRKTPVNVPGVRIVATTGAHHSCSLDSSRYVKCWGYNVYGQLGDGTTFSRSSPVYVSGLGAGVLALSAGGGWFGHTCAITSSGEAKCWGNNNYGQLGDGTKTQRLAPVTVSGLTSGMTAITTGYLHTCALTVSGGVKCWGENGSGQLGDGTNNASLTPVDVAGLTSGVAAISAGSYHTCALTMSGGAKCWGNNGWGQLGDGTTLSRLTPADVFGMTSGIVAISAGYEHSCAVMASGSAKCWGHNTEGQLGNGEAGYSTYPRDVLQ